MPASSASDGDLVDRVRHALSGVRKVEEKRMFGGTGFMVRGNLCVTARGARLMCRIDPADHATAIKRKGAQTVVMKDREYRGYVWVDAASLRTDKALLSWIEQALEFNRTLPEKAK